MKTGTKTRHPHLRQNVVQLAAQLGRMKKQAAELGVFINDRELLECPECGLAEDVTSNGFLITYRGNPCRPRDSGLRFKELTRHRFRCPSCRTVIEARIL
jgi:hypothetical protein